MAVLLNPPFDPRILNIGSHTGAPRLTRGWLTHAPNDAQGAARTMIGRINFLYNPPAIDVSHSISVDMLGGSNVTDPNNNTQTGNVVGIGDISVQLLFDRTYEMWDSSKKNTNAGRFGMYADVLAFYHFVGMTGPIAATNASSGLWGFDYPISDVTQFWATQYPIQPATPTPAYLYIGNRLKYYGAVSGLSVTYSHWSQDMVPMRGAVTLGMQLQADPNKSPQVKIGTAPTPSGVTNNPLVPTNPLSPN